MAKMKKGGLGRGLDALISEGVMQSEPTINQPVENVIIETNKEKIPKESLDIGFKVKISLLEPNRDQPRKDFNEESLQELADSISQYGILQPLLVKKKNDFYEIIAGERRWRAAMLAGLKEVPVIVKEYSDREMMEISLIENIQREDLNAIEEAKGYQKLLHEFELTQEDIAKRVSKSRSAITNIMRLLKLDQRVQTMLIDNELSSGHARTLLSLEDKEVQFHAAQKVISESLSVRETENLVKLLLNPPKKKEEKEQEKDDSFIYQEIEERIKSIMGTKVTINKKDKNKGKIEIEYYSTSELDRIIELMESIH